MIDIAFVVTVLGEIALPLGIFLWLKKRYGVKWMLFGVGVLTFIASQVVHIPLLVAFNQILKLQLPPYDVSYPAIFLEAGLLGLLAGLRGDRPPGRVLGLERPGENFRIGAGIGSRSRRHRIDWGWDRSTFYFCRQSAGAAQ